jgi:YQGE family putative transporter
LVSTGPIAISFRSLTPTFLYTLIAVAIPVAIGWFLQLQGGDSEIHRGYQIITGVVFLIAIVASFVCFRGSFTQPEDRKFIYFKFHPLWRKFLVLASLKGLVQGFLVTAPAMLVMLLLGKEGALGTAQSVGAIIAATAMYFIGRYSSPQHRLHILTAGLVLFAIAAAFNAIMFNATGVVLFLMFLLLAKPLMDLAYFPIQYRVINVVGEIENRSEYAYILNHEAGLWIGRFLGAGTFLALAFGISNEVALRYAVLIAAMVQLGSIWIARGVLKEAEVLSAR